MSIINIAHLTTIRCHVTYSSAVMIEKTLNRANKYMLTS